VPAQLFLFRWLGCACLWITLVAAVSAASWSPRQFGAVSDGTTLNTAAFQAAIDAAHAAGGGIVEVPAGQYLTGTLELRTGVTLHLESGSTLLGSPRIADYRRGSWPALIIAKGQSRLGITGAGTIDGQGKLVAADTLRIYHSGHFVDFFPGLQPGQKVNTGIGTDSNPMIDPYAMQRAGTLRDRVASRNREDAAIWRVDEFVRPQILEFWQCQGVTVTGVTLQHAASWVQAYRECDDVSISHIRVDSTTYWNNDGLDLVNCRRVRIEDCDINAADDGICLKTDPSPSGRGCEDIGVARCRIRSSASAFKLGTGSHQIFRHIRAEDLEVYDTYRAAVALESVDGGSIEDVRIARVRAKNTGCALFLRIGQRNQTKPAGSLRDVEISDLTVQIAGGQPDKGYDYPGPPIAIPTNVIPSSIVGLPDQKIENVTLRNIHITAAGGGRRDRAEVTLGNLASIPEKRANYPEFSMFGELPAWGLFVRHVQGLRLENVTLELASPDFRSAIVADDVHGMAQDGLQVQGGKSEPMAALSTDSSVLKRLHSPMLWAGTTAIAYRDPLLMWDGGNFRLFFSLATHDAAGKAFWQTAYSVSRDLRDWSPAVPITAHDRNYNFCSPGSITRYDGKWVLALQSYPTPHGEKFGNQDSRLWLMRSSDLEQWSAPELLRFMGPAVLPEAMPRMIDPCVVADKDDPHRWWCFCKVQQTGVSLAWSRDLRDWNYEGRVDGGENPCVVVDQGQYVLFHSPKNGIGIKRSLDLHRWEDNGTITLGQAQWPWAQGRITAGYVLDGREIPGVHRWVMVFHGEANAESFTSGASIGIAWSSDLKHWEWPKG